MSDVLSVDPWVTLRDLCTTSRVRRLDILTGYLGHGFSGVLRELRIEQCRLILGWDGKSPTLSRSVLAEIASLGSTLEVRWLPGLHAKMYIVPGAGFVVGSANFTSSAFERLGECVLATNRKATTREAGSRFQRFWSDANPLKPLGRARTGRRGESGEAHSLGVSPTRRHSPFLHTNSADGPREGKSNPSLGPVVRLCAYSPEWLLHEKGFERIDAIRWSTGAKVKPGDLQVFCVSTNLAGSLGPEATRLRESRAFDAVHSIWRATSGVKKSRGRWPHQADFELVVRLRRPVKKAELLGTGILRVPGWPQQPGGKLLSADQIATMTRVLAARNPGQAKAIRSAMEWRSWRRLRFLGPRAAESLRAL